MVKWLIPPSFIALVFIAVTAGHVSALEPPRPGQESFITRALFVDERLWVLSDAGVLSSTTEGDDRWREEQLSEPVFDACVLAGELVVATGKREDTTEWVVRRRTGGAWLVQEIVARESDHLLALDCAADQLTLVTSRRLIDVDGNAQHAVLLSGKLKRGFVRSVYGTADEIFVGANAGEWGGGLDRIDRRTGKITGLERSGEWCAGPLNTDCDPVNGIESEPWKPDCVAVAIGLVHMSPHGRIVEVCGDQIESLYYKPYEDASPAAVGSGNDEPFETVAFFGLIRDETTLWATGIDGIYGLGSDGVQQIPLPAFKTIGNIRVSFELPHLIVVETAVNARKSLSGSVPILVAR